MSSTTSYQGNKIVLIIVLGLLTTVGPLAIDLYLPAFPEIAEDLETDKISLSLSSFFLGLALGQLFYGPILERYGRKYPVYTGLVLFSLASLGCALSTSLEQLMVFRFIQAIGSCAGLVAARTIVRDLFDTKETARIFSLLLLVVAVSPIFAPSIGSLIYKAFGWHSIFVVLIILALLLLVCIILVLPHTKPADPTYSLRFGKTLKNYFTILKNPHFHVFAISGALPYGGLYAYLSTSPHLYLETFKISEDQFGYVFAIIAAGLIASSYINNVVLKRHDSEKVIPIVLKIQIAFGVIFTVVIFTIPLNIYVVTLLTMGFMSCIGFIFPNASALSLKHMGHTAGNASALMGALQMIWGGIISSIVTLLLRYGVWPMPVSMLFCSVMALVVFSYGMKKFARK